MATAAAMEEAERKIRRDTPPGGSRVDTLRKLFKGNPAFRMKIQPDTQDSASSEGSGRAARHRRKGKGKTLERARRAAGTDLHNSKSCISCSDGDGRERQHRREPTGCWIGVARGCG